MGVLGRTRDRRRRGGVRARDGKAQPARHEHLDRARRPIDDCRQMRVTFDDVDAARAEETVSVPAPRGALRFRAPSNSGIFVSGSTGADVSVTACKAAAASGTCRGSPCRSMAGNSPCADRGPRLGRAPDRPRAARAGLDLDVTNGPVAVRGMTGAVTAHTQTARCHSKTPPGRSRRRRETAPSRSRRAPARSTRRPSTVRSAFPAAAATWTSIRRTARSR